MTAVVVSDFAMCVVVVVWRWSHGWVWMSDAGHVAGEKMTSSGLRV